MKRYILIIAMVLSVVGCNKALKEDPSAIKVNGKIIPDKYQLSMYETKPDASFVIMIANRTYLKFILADGNIQEGIFDGPNVKIVDDGKTLTPYALVIWKNVTNNNYFSYQSAFSNATDVYIYVASHQNSPLNAEY